MNTPKRKHCGSCGAPLENVAAPFCPSCGHIRDGITEAEAVGCLATSYRVMLADRTVIGPIPASTIISMIQAGTIKPDHPIVNMDTGKAFFPDEDPVIRFLVGLDGPVSLPIPQLQPSLMGLALPLDHPSSSKQQAVLVSFLVAMLIALALLTRGIWLDTLTHIP